MRIEIGKTVQGGRNSGKAEEGCEGVVFTACKSKIPGLLGFGNSQRKDSVRNDSEFFWERSDYFGKIISS
jgi:hypothetical protein